MKNVYTSGSDCGSWLQGFQAKMQKRLVLFPKKKKKSESPDGVFLLVKINLKTISQLWTLVAQIKLHGQNLCIKRKLT